MKWRRRTWKQFVAVVVAASALGVAACGSDDLGDDDAADVADLTGEKNDGVSRPVGTFHSEAPWSGLGFEKLVLLSNGRFHWEHRVACVSEPCVPFLMTNGRYRFTKAGRTTYIRFDDVTGSQLKKLPYRMSTNDVLELRAVGSTAWKRFKKPAAAWCAEPPDCELQRLAPPSCAGAWTCARNQCAFECGRRDR